MNNIVNRSNGSLLFIVVLVTFVLFKTKHGKPQEDISIWGNPISVYQKEAFVKAAEHVQATRDCRSWTSIGYSIVKSADEKNMVIKNDAENHEHRLDSWNKKWKSYAKNVPRSGIGSTLQSSQNFREGMEKIVDYLKTELKKDKISILDSSCGDMNWMPTFLRGRTDIDYTGYDLLPVNIETAREKFKNETWKFDTFDLVKDRIKIQFDLLINRHTAIHLGLQDNIQMFHNFYQSGSKYLLTTTYPLQTRNTQLFLPGDRKFHEINLSLLPFQFPIPLCQSPDATQLQSSKYQFYGLWDFKELGGYDGRNRDFIRPFET